MTVTINLTDSDIFTALRARFADLLGVNIEIVQCQYNDVPLPRGDFVVINSLSKSQMSFPVTEYDGELEEKAITQPIECGFQVDFLGTKASEWAVIAQGIFSSQFANEGMPDSVRILFATEFRQIAFINEASQYEQRFTGEVVVQYNPTIAMPQEFITAASFEAVPVDLKL